MSINSSDTGTTWAHTGCKNKIADKNLPPYNHSCHFNDASLENSSEVFGVSKSLLFRHKYLRYKFGPQNVELYSAARNFNRVQNFEQPIIVFSREPSSATSRIRNRALTEQFYQYHRSTFPQP